MPPTPQTTLTSATPQRQIYTVARLNAEVSELLEGNFPLTWVEGEISNLARPASGHLYFSLKDSRAQVRCAMFRNRNQLVRFKPENGDQVLIRAQVGLYAQRGEFQLVVEHMEPAGEGALLQQLERLKERLQAEGLFQLSSKQALPTLPTRIGVITSASGAAVRDIITTLRRRFALAEVVIIPCLVQGSEAPASIVTALQAANEFGALDVILLGRGGGSLEDLWAFNNEAVVRAICASTIPVIAGIGHEVDNTLSDLAADLRAPTPTAAAEFAVPDSNELTRQLSGVQQRLLDLIQRKLRAQQQRLDWLRPRLPHPTSWVTAQRARTLNVQKNLQKAFQHKLTEQQQRLHAASQRLHRFNPSLRLVQMSKALQQQRRRLVLQQRHQLDRCRSQLAQVSGKLDAVSPLSVLARGYALVSRPPDLPVIHAAEQVEAGDLLEVKLSRGKLRLTVKESLPNG